MMNRHIKVIFCILLMLVAVSSQAGEIVYNKFNIHVHEHIEHDATLLKAHYTGYVFPLKTTNNFIIPPGTAFKVGRWPQGFVLEKQDDGMLIYYVFSRRNMKMKVNAYIDLIFSARPELLPGLTRLDHQGISRGRALVGMTRNGVLMALGYPAKHKTPALEGAFWTYWKDRWRTLRVDFDRNGKVARVLE